MMNFLRFFIIHHSAFSFPKVLKSSILLRISPISFCDNVTARHFKSPSRSVRA